MDEARSLLKLGHHGKEAQDIRVAVITTTRSGGGGELQERDLARSESWGKGSHVVPRNRGVSRIPGALGSSGFVRDEEGLNKAITRG